MKHWALILLVLAMIPATGCTLAGGDGEEAATPEPSAEEPDVDTLATITRGEPAPDEDIDLGSRVDGSPTLGSPGPQETGQEQLDLGWVSVSSSDGSSYEVWQQGSARGRTSIRLGQRPGVASYELRNSGRTLCRGRVDVERFESLCIMCDVESGQFRRVAC